MSQKDESGKQAQDYRDSFNHFDEPMFTPQVRLLGRACFKVASSVPDNGFAGTARAGRSRARLAHEMALTGRPIDMGGSHLEVIEKRRKVPDIPAINIRTRPSLD